MLGRAGSFLAGRRSSAIPYLWSFVVFNVGWDYPLESELVYEAIGNTWMDLPLAQNTASGVGAVDIRQGRHNHG